MQIKTITKNKKSKTITTSKKYKNILIHINNNVKTR